ncbi:MAG TPA: ATP-binding protein [Ktedonobacteraceae bacterium]|nr:ATP-binding protein [Ktedonobacteraceae bacterium]
MGIQDITRLSSEASELATILQDLTRLGQRTGMVADGQGTGSIASALLECLACFFGAGHGALLLDTQGNLEFGRSYSPASLYENDVRVLALHRMGENDSSILLDASASHYEKEQPGSALLCSITYRLPVGYAASESRRLQASQIELLPCISSNAAPQPLEALLLLSWDDAEEMDCSMTIERAHRLLPQIADAAGAVIGNILLAERVQELEHTAMREALAGMELLKAELLGTVSHELRSPLASIKGYAATLLRHERRLAKEERHQFLLAINEGCDRLEIIIERLLEMSQLDTKAIRLVYSTVDVARLAQEAIGAAEERIVARFPNRFHFSLRIEKFEGIPVSTVPLIMGDQRRLREVLDNLLENAIKYSPAGGTITILIRPAAQDKVASSLNIDNKEDTHGSKNELSPMLEICVIDTGIGIPAEHIERIFDRFHRVDMRLTREVNGLGLGLAISKRIVEMHGGVIWAESSGPGGSIFHVLLPLQEKEG